MDINFSGIDAFTKVKRPSKFHAESVHIYKVIKILWFCLHFHIEESGVKNLVIAAEIKQKVYFV